MASVPQREQLASMPESPLPKGKGTEPSVQSTRSLEGESQGGQEPHLGERGGIRVRAWSGKGGLHGEGRQIPRTRGKAS